MIENEHLPVKQALQLKNKQVQRKLWEMESADTILL
jgi:hypothetical protein